MPSTPEVSGASAPPARATSMYPSAIARAASPMAMPDEAQALLYDRTGPITRCRIATWAPPALPMIAIAVNGRDACLPLISRSSNQAMIVAVPPLMLL